MVLTHVHRFCDFAGARFTPSQSGPRLVHMDPKSKSSGQPKSAMIFSADEEEAGRLRQLLSDNGVEVYEWNRTGANWIGKWQKLKPFVVFVDHILPAKEGLSILKNIIHHVPESFVVFSHAVTGVPANEIEMKALRRGAKAVIQKPFTEANVRVCVSRLKEK